MPELIAYLEMSQPTTTTILDTQVYWTGVMDSTGVIVQLTDDLQTNNIYTT